MRLPAFFTASVALGDCISATPFVRKLSQVYNQKVRVFSHFPELFRNLPYVSASDDFKEYIDRIHFMKEKYDLHMSFFHMGQKVALSDSRGIEFKHAQMDIRQYHAIDNGFMLLKNELHCDFVPSENSEVTGLPSKYVVLHPFKNWESRTWAHGNWVELVEKLRKKNVHIVLIGKDGIDSSLLKHLQKTAVKQELFDELEGKQVVKIVTEGVIDLTNKTTLSEAWHILKGAKCVVTMDSGILHLAGTTLTHIVQLGSSIHPEFRTPYRMGSQDYNFHYVKGSCELFCASNLKYALTEWENGYNGATPLQSVPPLEKCLEKKPSYECHPSVEAVYDKICKIWDSEDPLKKKLEYVNTVGSGRVVTNRTLVKIDSGALGDNIGALAMVDLYEQSGNKVDVMCKFGEETFGKSYPRLNFLPMGDAVIDITTGEWVYAGRKYDRYKELRYVFDKPLMKGFADQLSIPYSENRPRIDVQIGERPIKNKYVCFSMHSTAQAKHWNYPNGWDKLCRSLRSAGITPVCIDRHPQFGIEGHWNPVPTSCVKRHDLHLSEMTNYIHHCEFFIGISSGLAWVAHAVGKPVVLISGVTSEDNEFSTDALRIIEKSVCHGCINKKEHKFDPGDWMWCPVHKGSAQQFECTTSITPEKVFDAISQRFSL